MRRHLRVALGLCLGASSIGLVSLGLEEGRVQVLRAGNRPHGGDPSQTLLDMLEEIPDWRSLPVGVTGRGLRSLVRLESIPEPEAVELAASFVLGDRAPHSIVLSAGGETFMAYGLDARGRVRDIQSGNKCASGTGEFLRQQLRRMGLAVGDLAGMNHGAPACQVSGRCSVFCKSDCTHALNKGAAKESVVAGLGRMMAGKCLELLQPMPGGKVVLVGGCAANPYLVRFLEEDIPELIVPGSAPWFEALGAGLWALDHSPRPPGEAPLVAVRTGRFAMLPPLSGFMGQVEFKEHPRAQAQPGDEVLAGLDVGSTTTKGVLLRRFDRAVLAGEYLRTEGDPVGASRRVYESLARQAGAGIRVVGLGVTGSGRAIAALHATASAAVNEIVAHAAAAAHYDPKVDTIFEIGGQDAKYTFLSEGHPCDTAMNEACSAGTGSFLEESARETLGVDTRDIGGLALTARATPNFNDQCAAFIGSDINLAVGEGLALPDILAGLTHSVCLNYVSRVKGNRPVGERVFMQGGVCYNRAVPAAMAMLTGKRIVVPPEPGLMGALGVALEIDRRMRGGILPEGDFDLDELAGRETAYREPFTCRGGRGGQAGCDRGCRIARIEVGGKVHPFGGICNRFENLRQGRAPDAARLDLVQARQRRVFRDHVQDDTEGRVSGKPVVGLTRSYLVNTYYPLFSTFFRELGFEVALPGRVDPEGIKRRSSALCYPAELAHGFMADLLARRPDVLFLPHVKGVPGAGGQDVSCTCVLLQGEPYYLRGAFPELRALGPGLLAPVLDFTRGLLSAEASFLAVARDLGAGDQASRRAFQGAIEAQILCRKDLLDLGRDALASLGNGSGKDQGFGVVLFGRAYNAFAAEANKGVPGKLATRGAMVIPCDILPLPQDRPDDFKMYWGLGRTIMAASRYVATRPGLFGAYVTNFSCGPDSFLLSYFRDEMAAKPSLTLELDSHTADAGLETRLEAFLDIADSHWRRLRSNPHAKPVRPGGIFGAEAVGGYRGEAANASGEKASVGTKALTDGLARMETRQGLAGVTTTSGEWLPLTHPRVRLAIPSMNPYGSALAANALSSGGVRGLALPPAGEEALKLGRGNSSCKECLPLQLTVGTLLGHLGRREQGEVTAYFMPQAQGPCRFGQYAEYSSRLIGRLGLADAAVLSPCAANGYAGLSGAVTLAIWRGTVAGDLFEEIRAVLLAGAKDPLDAEAALERGFERVKTVMGGPWKAALAEMRRLAGELSRMPLRLPRRDIPTLSLVGEIYVRHDPLSRQKLVERLAAKGFAVRTAPVSEWVFYTDWLQNAGLTAIPGLGARIRQFVKRRCFEQARAAFLPSGLLAPHVPDTRELIRSAKALVSPELTGEAILTVGSAFHEILEPACGIIAIGPFGCMPALLAEAVLSRSFTTASVGALFPWRLRGLPPEELGSLPFLAVETDGNPFPQLIEARLEAFCMQAIRLHEAMRSGRAR